MSSRADETFEKEKLSNAQKSVSPFFEINGAAGATMQYTPMS